MVDPQVRHDLEEWCRGVGLRYDWHGSIKRSECIILDDDSEICRVGSHDNSPWVVYGRAGRTDTTPEPQSPPDRFYSYLFVNGAVSSSALVTDTQYQPIGELPFLARARNTYKLPNPRALLETYIYRRLLSFTARAVGLAAGADSGARILFTPSNAFSLRHLSAIHARWSAAAAMTSPTAGIAIPIQPDGTERFSVDVPFTSGHRFLQYRPVMGLLGYDREAVWNVINPWLNVDEDSDGPALQSGRRPIGFLRNPAALTSLTAVVNSGDTGVLLTWAPAATDLAVWRSVNGGAEAAATGSPLTASSPQTLLWAALGNPGAGDSIRLRARPVYSASSQNRYGTERIFNLVRPS